FVALSYKWGSTASGAPTTPLPEFLPATVTDAIYVTMQLGYNYLWVDRYCISQNDQHAKHVQIQSMNLVYKHAALTIIAATGEDATAGLSGVRPRKKPMQLSIKLGHMQLVATMDQITDIATSPWNSRGWTFQEGLLSNRRLLFGPRQISFECQAMNCLESIKFPL
ncbi:heterokaryon incompatibility, partial [Thozetella sp. PMI_491]